MELSTYLSPERVVVLKTATKREALGELAGVLAGADNAVEQGKLEEAILKRESLMSTGIGNGLAIPHVRMSEVSSAMMTVGVSHNGIRDYASLDDEPIRIVVLIAAPRGQHETYIRLLATVSEVLRHSDMRRTIVDSDDCGEIYRILAKGGR